MSCTRAHYPSTGGYLACDLGNILAYANHCIRVYGIPLTDSFKRLSTQVFLDELNLDDDDGGGRGSGRADDTDAIGYTDSASARAASRTSAAPGAAPLPPPRSTASMRFHFSPKDSSSSKSSSSSSDSGGGGGAGGGSCAGAGSGAGQRVASREALQEEPHYEEPRPSSADAAPNRPNALPYVGFGDLVLDGVDECVESSTSPTPSRLSSSSGGYDTVLRSSRALPDAVPAVPMLDLPEAAPPPPPQADDVLYDRAAAVLQPPIPPQRSIGSLISHQHQHRPNPKGRQKKKPPAVSPKPLRSSMPNMFEEGGSTGVASATLKNRRTASEGGGGVPTELTFTESDIRTAMGHGAGAEPAYDFASTHGPKFEVVVTADDGSGAGAGAGAAVGEGSASELRAHRETLWDQGADGGRRVEEGADTLPPARPLKSFVGGGGGGDGGGGGGGGAGKGSDSASAMRLFQTMKMKPKPKKRMPPPNSGKAGAGRGAGSGGGGGGGRGVKKQQSLVVKPDIGGDAYSSSSDGGHKASTPSVTADDWRFARTDAGKIYYINIKTQETSWTLPPGCEPTQRDER